MEVGRGERVVESARAEKGEDDVDAVMGFHYPNGHAPSLRHTMLPFTLAFAFAFVLSCCIFFRIRFLTM